MNNFPIILSANDFKEWDLHTIQYKKISSLQLMEQAAEAVCRWIKQNYHVNQSHFYIFCGTGNNGGDGFAIARLLQADGFLVETFLIGEESRFTTDSKRNYSLIKNVSIIEDSSDFPTIDKNIIVIDAILGIGLTRNLEGIFLQLVEYINQYAQQTISIDIPTGLYADICSIPKIAIQANKTLSFGNIKQSFVLPESEKFTGEVVILDIGLSKDFIPTNTSNYYWVNLGGIQGLLKPNYSFSHKGSNGHAALLVGSIGMMGAAILSSRACMRAGAGKTTCILPQTEFPIIYQTCPEVLLKNSSDKFTFDQYNSIGIGSGLGTDLQALKLLNDVLKATKPLVIDADAINMISLMDNVIYPTESILTPHVKEAMRLTGFANNSIELLNHCIDYSNIHQVYIVLKGKYSRIICPTGEVYFNTTGNPGMASAGMGDVLTGIITSLLAQGYSCKEACIIGVYWHGLAADLAAEDIGYPSLLASDVIEYLGKSYLKMNPLH